MNLSQVIRTVRSVGVFLLASHGWAFALAPLAQGEDFAPVSSKVADTPRALQIRIGSGVGTFQDVQLPLGDAESNLRSDGRVVDAENGTHMGFPFFAGLGYLWKSGQLKVRVLDFEALYMRATTGPAATQSASYSRLSLGTRLGYSLGIFNGRAEAILGGGLRRSSYNNVSSGHFVEGALVEGGVGYGSQAFRLSLLGGLTPVARFGYSDAPVLGGHTFNKSRATLSNVQLTCDFPLTRRAFLETGVEREVVHATIEDVTEYEGFGLTVSPLATPTRAYNLVTTMVRLGIRKNF